MIEGWKGRKHFIWRIGPKRGTCSIVRHKLGTLNLFYTHSISPTVPHRRLLVVRHRSHILPIVAVANARRCPQPYRKSATSRSLSSSSAHGRSLIKVRVKWHRYHDKILLKFGVEYSTVMIAHNSWRNLHGHQDQGAGHCLRVWRPVLLDRAVELQDRADGGRSAGA